MRGNAESQDFRAFCILDRTVYVIMSLVGAADKKTYALTGNPARELTTGITGTEQQG